MSCVARGAVAALALLAGCASPPAEELTAATPEAREPAAPFPPEGAVRMSYDGPPPEGSLYRLAIEFDGRTRVEGLSGAEPQMRRQEDQIEVYYRQRPTTPAEGELRSILILQALRHRHISRPPPLKLELEIANERVRMTVDGEPQIELRGNQRSGKLSATRILERPFALLHSDPAGNPTRVLPHGAPPARRFLQTVPLLQAVRYTQVALPDDEVIPGALWRASRLPPHPIGDLGLDLELDYRFIGYERIDGVPSARTLIRSRPASVDESDTFEEATTQLQGEAWIDLANGQLLRLRLVESSEVSRPADEDAGTNAFSASFNSRALVERLSAPVELTHWSDGDKLFADR